jgi:hypothetical protein
MDSLYAVARRRRLSRVEWTTDTSNEGAHQTCGEPAPRRWHLRGDTPDPDGSGAGTRESAPGSAGRVRRVTGMLRPESWSRLTGESPVRVGTGVPGSRPRFVAERRRAERGVESLFGGSKRAGRSVKRTLQPRQTHNGGAEPVMSRRRPCPSGPVPGSAWRVLPGYGGWHARTVWAGTGEARLPGLRRVKARGISRW